MFTRELKGDAFADIDNVLCVLEATFNTQSLTGIFAHKATDVTPAVRELLNKSSGVLELRRFTPPPSLLLGKQVLTLKLQGSPGVASECTQKAQALAKALLEQGILDSSRISNGPNNVSAVAGFPFGR